MREPKRIVWLLTDFGMQWAVLGVLRRYYTFREQEDIISKTGAGQYALRHLPATWHCVIREAVRIREHVGMPAYRMSISRAIEAHAFLRYNIGACNTAEEVRAMPGQRP